MTKKKIFAAALAVCLVAVISFSTLAWFTAEDSVTNDFYVGDSEDTIDKVFGIDVWETVDGVEIGKGTSSDEGAIYETILPGEKLSKEPVLTNTGVHPQYVRAIVTVTEAYILREAMEGAWGDAAKFLPGTGDKWTLTDILYTTDNELVYIYYYDEALAAAATTEALFKEVVIPTGLTLEQAEEMDQFSVSILGQVIQSEHLADPAVPGAMVTTAQRAFELYWDAEGTIAGFTADQILANGKAGENAGAVDVYYTVGEADTAEVSLTDIKASVNKAFVAIPAEYANVTVIIDSCELTLADGAFVVEAEGAGGLCVYISGNTVINGKAVSEMTKAERNVFFKNVLVFVV